MNATVNLDQQLERFHDYWHPKIVATINDEDVKLIKVQGELVWHQHQDTDELFLVIDGQLRIRLQKHGEVVLGPGERFVVPRGVRQGPTADQETAWCFWSWVPRSTPVMRTEWAASASGSPDRSGTTEQPG